MKNKFYLNCHNHSHGQGLLVGVVILLILLLVLLYAFDVHNIIRAKFKVETAQEAAAMAGANWQKETLNLIGELNLFKATALILEESPELNPPVPIVKNSWDIEAQKRRQKALQARLDLLTEAQTRISFIVPLVGLAAAQQAAKANGLSGKENFDTYLELLDTDKRYQEDFGGAPRVINNYAWKAPYREMVKTISDNGIAIFPNARITGFPRTQPPNLSYESFYDSVLILAEAVAQKDPPQINFYVNIGRLMKWPDAAYRNKWWSVDYSSILFPFESEIFSVGVEFDAEYDEKIAQQLRENFIGHPEFYPSATMLPGNMAWCRYDEWWYTKYYIDKYKNYKEDHLKYWFDQQVLRHPVKNQYRYEGPAAYAEGYADVGSVVNLRFRQGNSYEIPKGRSNDSKVLLAKLKNNKAEIFEHTKSTTVRVGTRRSAAQSSRVDTEYRPGAIVKPLGELKEQLPPTELPLILPIFNRISLMPTYMPIPYNFQVLKPGYAPLEKFLSWLAEQNSLDGTPPPGTEKYLLALRFWVYGVAERAAGSKADDVECIPGTKVAGCGLRYYLYNPKFNLAAFEAEWKEKIYQWKQFRDQLVFSQNNLLGPGYFQEPQLCRDTNNVPMLTEVIFPDGRKEIHLTISKTFRENRVKAQKQDPNRKKGDPVKDKYENVAIMDLITHQVKIRDQINGGWATRVYINAKAGAHQYYVIDANNNIVPNGEPDPTLFYNNYRPGGGGSGHHWNPGSFDGQKGPARL